MKCWQDKAMTVPAVKDGDPVAAVETGRRHPDGRPVVLYAQGPARLDGPFVVFGDPPHTVYRVGGKT